LVKTKGGFINMADYMAIETQNYVTRKEILMFPDNYQAFAQTFTPSEPTAVTEGDKLLVKAGTIWPANDDTARGVILYDCDVTKGTCTGAVVFEGTIIVPKIPEPPDDDAKAALPRITFFEEL
jgi:hypothetical protein